MLKYLLEHQVVLAIIFWPLLTAALNVLLRKKTAEEWEQWALTKPKLAFFVELLRAVGINPASLLKASQRYANRKAGNIPEGALLPEILKATLDDPEKRAALVEFAKTLRPSQLTSTTPPVSNP